MTDSKHTPGTWYWVGNYLENDERTILEHNPEASLAPTEADKRLIAAAPKLLEALRIHHEHCVRNQSGYDAVAYRTTKQALEAAGESL